MKSSHPRLQLATAFAALFTATLAPAATNIWSGASTPDLNWSTAGNWDPAGPPGVADAAFFFDPGAATDLVTIDNIVSANASIGSLWYGQTNNFHNTQVSAGAILTISNVASGGVILVGTETQPSITQIVSNTISGAGRVTVINTNANIIIRQTHATAGAHLAALDMSGLDTFSANVGRVLVGVGDSTFRRAEGRLVLAKTNTLTLSSSATQLMVGDNSGNNNANSSVSRMWLGQKNTFFLSWCEQKRTSVRSKRDRAVRAKEEFRLLSAIGGCLGSAQGCMV